LITTLIENQLKQGKSIDEIIEGNIFKNYETWERKKDWVEVINIKHKTKAKEKQKVKVVEIRSSPVSANSSHSGITGPLHVCFFPFLFLFLLPFFLSVFLSVFF
jgi:hypothetical protein